MSGGDGVCDVGENITSHPALIYDNVEKVYQYYTPDHCSFVAVFYVFQQS
jgi:hypothetical protein